MNTSSHNKLISFIWSIADDCLRDVYVRGKYRDVILPMVVLRRLDALLESSKEKVMEEVHFQVEEAGFTELDPSGLRAASGYVFYNTSPWTLKKLHDTATNNQKILMENFIDYLNGFSPNVKEIIEKFKLISQIRHMADKDVLLPVLEKFTSPYINLTPEDREDPDGYTLPGLSNLGMGYVFEELIRKFNEENNEEAGEHFTPREIIDLMTHIVFGPIKDQLPPVITIYDPACGSGGMLTEAQNFIKDEEGEIKALSDVYLYGKEINDETYAICKSDMMIKGNNPENIKSGSTLSTDEFAGMTFDFMLSNPPYGKSWSSEKSNIMDGSDVIDPRFEVALTDYWGKVETEKATPRSSDGQLLFLMEMVDKMKHPDQSAIGSRIASVHNGSSLFTGDAGSGESNIRRHIIENDLLVSIIQLPNNLFYNTGITTYIWILSNNKKPHCKGKVQLIDANGQYRKLRKNLGSKNCELAPEHIDKILNVFNSYEDVEAKEEGDIASKIFDNEDFGYYKVTVERPERLKVQFSKEALETLRYTKYLEEPMQWAYEMYGEDIYADFDKLAPTIVDWCEKNEISLSKKNKKKLLNKKNWESNRELVDAGTQLMDYMGREVFMDFNAFEKEMKKAVKELGLDLSASDKKHILNAISEYDESAEKVIKKKQKIKGKKMEELLLHLGCMEQDLPHFGYYPSGKPDEYIIYESSSDLRDYETVPIKDNVLAYFLKEVKPHVDEAWIDLDKTKIGYEISFNKYFYKHKPLRSLEEVSAEILELEKENEGLIMDILKV
jgi:type I restriction enzyme M protein